MRKRDIAILVLLVVLIVLLVLWAAGDSLTAPLFR